MKHTKTSMLYSPETCSVFSAPTSHILGRSGFMQLYNLGYIEVAYTRDKQRQDCFERASLDSLDSQIVHSCTHITSLAG